MEQNVIIEKLKEIISGRKILAAVFYTFNFDARFFENYLLPLFLPDVNFSEIEIQNSILWRKYVNDLPLIAVYCDFHAKSNQAPTLHYDVRAIDIKSGNGKKPCFHPKNSFILLEDGTLVVMTGSNNLSVGGWCTNVEGISIFEMKNGSYFPYPLKHQLWGFMKDVCIRNEYKYTKAEEKLDAFFRQRMHTDESDKRFYYSISSNLYDLFKQLVAENENLPFKRIEVFSPYFSTRLEFIKKTVSFSKENLIHVLVPYRAANLADITQDIYMNFQAAGIKWSRLLQNNEDKVFRLNHSKIYRLKGENKMFTIIGSANYTDAGWAGTKQNGNVESAMVYIAPIDKWKDWLIESRDSEIQFSSSNGDETASDQRYDVPDIQFILDWYEKELTYQVLKKSDFSGTIMLPGKNYEISTEKEIKIHLNNDQINSLTDNSIIKVHQHITQREFYFFPRQLNYECKPYSSKLKLNDRELIELWQQVSIKEKDKNEIGNLIEKFILSRVDNEGELVEKKRLSKSTMNMIASHINALIKLETRIFEQPSKKNDFGKQKELLDYYLFNNNIDTLIGYRNLLKEMATEKAILPGVQWFLLNLLFMEFYDYTKVAQAYENLKTPNDKLKEKVEKYRFELSEEMKLLKRSLRSDVKKEKLYKWIVNQLRK